MNERFPPLRERLSGASKQVLLSELGKGYQRGWIVTYPVHRDEVVLRELLRRHTLTVDDMETILLGHRMWDANLLEVFQRLNPFHVVVAEQGALGQLAPAIAEVLIRSNVLRSAEQGFGPLFASMRLAKVDFQATAFELIRLGKFTRESINYLADTGDQKTLERLRTLTLDNEYQSQLDDAIDKINFGWSGSDMSLSPLAPYSPWQGPLGAVLGHSIALMRDSDLGIRHRTLTGGGSVTAV